MTNIKSVLIAIDKVPQWKLEELMKPYIDTPGSYKDERKYYKGVEEYYKLNMGKGSYAELLEWIKSHPKECAKIIKLSKKKH